MQVLGLFNARTYLALGFRKLLHNLFLCLGQFRDLLIMKSEELCVCMCVCVCVCVCVYVCVHGGG